MNIKLLGRLYKLYGEIYDEKCLYEYHRYLFKKDEFAKRDVPVSTLQKLIEKLFNEDIDSCNKQLEELREIISK